MTWSRRGEQGGYRACGGCADVVAAGSAGLEESGVHTVQRGAEAFDHPGQPGHDLGKLLDHPPAA